MCSYPQKEHQERLYKISKSILNGSEKVDVICQNKPQNTTKKKVSISDNQGYTKNTCTKFHNKILNSYLEKTSTYAKISPKIPQNDPQQREGIMSKVF